jgi:hypothetical protein
MISRAWFEENDVSDDAVVVPIPRDPKKKDGVVDVEMRDPTVSCDVVAMMSVPLADAVSIAPLAKARVAVRVPDVVTGEFVIVKAVGRDRPTDVTVPWF